MLTTWLAAISLVAYQALAWSYKPGETGNRPTSTPAGLGLRAVMLVHPDCPCTEASLKLYADAIRLSKQTIHTQILVPAPGKESGNVKLARAVPQAEVAFVAPSEIYGKYGVSTSGHLLVWAGKRLIFSGGVTDARGEDVMASSFDELLAVLTSKKQASQTPVFGCTAFDRKVNG